MELGGQGLVEGCQGLDGRKLPGLEQVFQAFWVGQQGVLVGFQELGVEYLVYETVATTSKTLLQHLPLQLIQPPHLNHIIFRQQLHKLIIHFHIILTSFLQIQLLHNKNNLILGNLCIGFLFFYSFICCLKRMRMLVVDGICRGFRCSLLGFGNRLCCGFCGSR